MTHEELLVELRDISPPLEPAWWLLAPGYTMLLSLGAIAIGLLWYALYRRRTQRRLRQARTELYSISSRHRHNQDPRRLALELSRWLKQVALLAYPERGPEGLTGVKWLAFLDETLGDDKFSRGEGRVFGDAIYRRQAAMDATSLLELCESWLDAVAPELLRRRLD